MNEYFVIHISFSLAGQNVRLQIFLSKKFRRSSLFLRQKNFPAFTATREDLASHRLE